MEDSKMLLVLWDFTILSEYALEHAIKIAKSLDKEIRLLHVIKASTSNEERNQIQKRLDEIVDKTNKEHQLKVDSIILKGSLFTKISDYASEQNANFVMMGTHGLKGLQNVTGSHALKVIIGSSVPFIVVQDKPNQNAKYSNVVFPVDFKSESREKLVWAIYMGKYFNSKVHLFVLPSKDKSLQKKINTNTNFAIRFLIQNNLEYEIHTAERKLRFSRETVQFANKINADLILVMTTKYISFLDYMLGAEEQYLIANEAKIPVMCINPKANFATVGQFMFGR
jgi:nucleotide-binding universal stress UspA family protein